MEREAPEWAEDLIEALDAVETVREKFGEDADGIDRMAKALKHLPAFVRNDDLMLAADGALPDAAELVTDIIRTCHERGYLLGKRILIEWRTGKWASSGMVVRGKAGPVPKRQRATWPPEDGPPPWYRITLSLPAWLLMDDDARYRLIHHEMGHCGVSDAGDPSVIAHDVEDFVSTASRFGPSHPDECRLAQAVAQHPETPIRMRSWEVDDRGQGQLFGAWKGPAPKPDDD